MIRVSTLKKRSDFVYLREHGQRVAAQGFTVQWAVKEGEAGVSVGFTASTKAIGNAVKRNRAKRRLRACFDKVVRLNSACEAPQGLWVVWVANAAILTLDFKYVEKDMRKVLVAAGVKV
ncbi:MAG: ribonuclease P protein component [Alphaproteobacteria bacterium]